MMFKLRKAGLFMMLLGAVIATIYPFWYNYMYSIHPHLHWDTWLFIIASLPALLVTGISWRWPLVGSSIAAGLSLFALTYFVASVINPSMEPTTNYLYLVITVSYLVGSALVLTSYVKAKRSESD